MSIVTRGKDLSRDFLHAELDRLLDQVPAFGYIEFHIAFKNKLPINIDIHVNQAMRILPSEEGVMQRPEDAQSKDIGYVIGRK